MSGLDGKKMSFLRKWCTPLVIGSFLISGLTGIAIFFDFETRLGKEIHEWCGLFFVLGAVGHVVGNWKSFTKYFTLKQALALIIPLILVAVVALVPWSKVRGGGDGDKEQIRERLRGGQAETGDDNDEESDSLSRIRSRARD